MITFAVPLVRSSLFLFAALLALAAPAATVVNDSFADGNSENQDLAAGSLRVFNGRAGSVNPRTTVAGSTTIQLLSSSSEAFWAFFTASGAPITLGVGERLSASMTFRTGSTPSGDIRFGLFHSNATRNALNLSGGMNDASFADDVAYGADFFPSGVGAPFIVGRRSSSPSNANNPFNSFGDFPTLAETSGAAARIALAANTDYTIRMTVERETSTRTVVSVQVTGGDLPSDFGWSGVDTGSPLSTFDCVAFRIAGSTFASTITLTNILVQTGSPAPTIASQPTPATATVVAGGGASFTVVAAGSGVSYLWRKDGQPLDTVANPTAATATLTLTGLQPADSGIYSVIVSNESGAVTSDGAGLTVTAPATAFGSFVSAAGLDPATNGAFLADPDADGLNNLYEFYLGGNPAVADPAIQPTAATNGADASALLFQFNRRIGASAIAARVEQSPDLATWTTATPGADGVALAITPVDSVVERASYTLPVAGNRLFARLVLTTPVAPTISAAPVSTTARLGQPATLTVTPDGTAPFTYQWFKNGNAIVGANAATYTIPATTFNDEASYVVTVTNAAGFVTTAAATLTVTNLPPSSQFALAGFASLGTGTTGGGSLTPFIIDATTANPAQALKTYLESASALVVDVRVDIDLGVLRNMGRQAIINPTLIASGVGSIKVGSNKTLFSSTGATLSHGGLTIDNQRNIIIRNLRFRGLWEWDDSTAGAYDLQSWDYIAVTNGARNVWIDHCDFEKSYDGIVDVTNGADLVTISWCRIAGDTAGTLVTSQINHLESLYQANPADSRITYYASLRAAGRSVATIIASELPQDKTHLVGSADNNTAIDTPGGLALLNVTLHHNVYLNTRDRIPRERYGNAHVYNVYVDNSGIPSGTNQATISTTGGAVLVENTYYRNVGTPLRNTSGTSSIGKIIARGSTRDTNGILSTTFSNQNPSDPSTFLFNAAANFTFSNFAALPYTYTLDTVDYMKTNAAAAGVIVPGTTGEATRLAALLPSTNP